VACRLPRAALRSARADRDLLGLRAHSGQLIVNANAVAPLSQVFRRLYAMRLPIRHMQLSDEYGPDACIRRTAT
jgi:hypothetical protein